MEMTDLYIDLRKLSTKFLFININNTNSINNIAITIDLNLKNIIFNNITAMVEVLSRV